MSIDNKIIQRLKESDNKKDHSSVAFRAILPDIQKAISDGFSIAQIHRYYAGEGLTDLSYNAFRARIRRSNTSKTSASSKKSARTSKEKKAFNPSPDMTRIYGNK